jgi:hypothetical protein
VRERLKVPGIIGAMNRVAKGSVCVCASRWRVRGRVPVKPAMRDRVLEALVKAEKLMAHEARVKAARGQWMERLRVELRKLGHGACKGAPVTLRLVAERAGIGHQRLVNFRIGDKGMGDVWLTRVERALGELVPVDGPELMVDGPIPKPSTINVQSSTSEGVVS